MNPEEYDVLARVEETHWWYLGLRDVLTRVLRRPDLAPPPGARVLDAGCGTGANLRLLRSVLDPAYLGGFDPSGSALAHARLKAPGTDLYASDLCDPEIRVDELDLVVSLDVLYIPGAGRARPGLARIVERLRPGGRLLLHLPAYDWLYSAHDVAIHTAQRFTLGEVRSLMEGLGLEVELATYRMCLLFPAVVAARLPSILGPRPALEAARSDLQRHPGPVSNRALLRVLLAENALTAAGTRLPFGSSVLAVGRRLGTGADRSAR